MFSDTLQTRENTAVGPSAPRQAENTFCAPMHVNKVLSLGRESGRRRGGASLIRRGGPTLSLIPVSGGDIQKIIVLVKIFRSRGASL